MHVKFYQTIVDPENVALSHLAHSDSTFTDSCLTLPMLENENEIVLSSDTGGSINCSIGECTFDWSVLCDSVGNDCTQDCSQKLLENIMSIKGFKMVHLNCASLMKHIDQLRLLLYDSKIHVISFNETRLDCNISDNEVEIAGYSIVRRDRNRNGGGVALFVMKSLNYELLTFDNPGEIESVSIKISLGTKPLAVTTIYRPPSANIDYHNKMVNLMDRVVSSTSNAVFLGDFNYNVYDKGLAFSKVLDICNLLQLQQLVESPTRVTPISTSCIDLIFSNLEHKLTGVTPLSISDHYMVYTVLDFKPKFRTPHVIKTRTYNNFNHDSLVSDIVNSVQLNSVFSNTDMETAWNIFITEFKSICNRYAPLREYRLKERQNPWINNDVLKLMYHRDYLHRKALISKTTEAWSTYKHYRNLVNCSVRKLKQAYFKNEVNKFSNNSKGMWKTLNHILPSKKSNSCLPSYLKPDDFNNYFTSIGKQLSTKFDKNNLPEMP